MSRATETCKKVASTFRQLEQDPAASISHIAKRSVSRSGKVRTEGFQNHDPYRYQNISLHHSCCKMNAIFLSEKTTLKSQEKMSSKIDSFVSYGTEVELFLCDCIDVDRGSRFAEKKRHLTTYDVHLSKLRLPSREHPTEASLNRHPQKQQLFGQEWRSKTIESGYIATTKCHDRRRWR